MGEVICYLYKIYIRSSLFFIHIHTQTKVQVNLKYKCKKRNYNNKNTKINQNGIVLFFL